MRLDHVSYAAEADGVGAAAARLGEVIGVDPVDGGIHPRLGTRTMLLPLAGGHYVEVAEALEHPATLSAPFGQAVRARTKAGGGWLTWVVAVEDLSVVERRLGCVLLDARRRNPEGTVLYLPLTGAEGSAVDPQLPFLTRWESGRRRYPALTGPTGAPQVRLASVRVSGSPYRLESWLGEVGQSLLDDVEVEWVAPRGTPGLLGVCFETAQGRIVC
jgi:hypothetical protein